MVEQATVVKAPLGAAPAPPGTAGRVLAAQRLRRMVERREMAIFLVAIIIFLYFWLSTSAFASYLNFVTLTQFLAPIAVIGAGEAILLTAGEVDLSAGTAYVFFPFVVYFLWANHGVPIGLAIVIAVAAAVCFGLINGLLTTLLELPSFVTTLGTLFALYGIMLVTSGGIQETISVTGEAGKLLGCSAALAGTTPPTTCGAYNWSEILWALALVAIMYVVLHRSRFGAHVVATGGNVLGAAEAGVPVRRVKVWCFILVSTVAALSGIIDAIRIGTLDPGNDGTTEMFYAIAAAVIGGTALTGGRGTIIGAVVGGIVLGVFFDGLYIKGISAYWFQLVLGVAILVAMAANVQLRRAAMRRWKSLRR